MANVRISGDTSGYVELQAPAVAGTTVITLPSSTTELVVQAEGTWTPSFQNGAWTYTAQSGKYHRIGELVLAWFDIVWTANDQTGDATLILGLPFNCEDYASATLGYIAGAANANNTTLMGLGNPNNSYIALRYQSNLDNNPVDTLNSDLGPSGRLIGQITYRRQ